MINLAVLEWIDNSKLPSSAVVTPVEDPLTETETRGIGLPFSSSTLPVRIRFCACICIQSKRVLNENSASFLIKRWLKKLAISKFDHLLKSQNKLLYVVK